MNCCLDCIRFLNRKGYQRIGKSINKKYDSNNLEEIVIVKNDNSKEILNLNNNKNNKLIENTNSKKVNIEKLSFIQLKEIVNDEEDIIFDLKNIKLEKNNSENLAKYNSNIKTKGVVNNLKNEFSSLKKNNKIKPKNKNIKNKLIRKKNIEKKNKLNFKLKNTDIPIMNNIEIKNKLFKEKLSDEEEYDNSKDLYFEILDNNNNNTNNNTKILNTNQNLRNRNEGLSDIEWDIISDDAF